MQDVLDAYKAMGYTAVTRNNHWHQLELLDGKGQMTMATECVPPKGQVVFGPQTGVSPLTSESGECDNNHPIDVGEEDLSEEEDNDEAEPNVSTSKSGNNKKT
jgi:hypothetical protein